jgi:hypothetical protein
MIVESGNLAGESIDAQRSENCDYLEGEIRRSFQFLSLDKLTTLELEGSTFNDALGKKVGRLLRRKKVRMEERAAPEAAAAA